MIAALLNSRTKVLDAGRNAGAVILFVVWPVVQSFFPRSTPLFLALAVSVILIMGLVSRLRNEPGEYEPAAWPPKPVVFVFAAYLLLMGVSLLGSPLPERGAKDISTMLAGFLCAVFLIRHLPRVTLLPLPVFVLIALIIGSTGLILESWRVTSLHDTFLDTNFIYDLNRNASWLLVAGCAALVSFQRREISSWSAVLAGLLVAFAVFSGQGEAAKLALGVACVAALIACFMRVLIKPLFIGFAVCVLAMPIIASALSDSNGKLRVALPLGAHADHRVALWQGYADLVQQRPVFGWGTKADRKLGLEGDAAKVADERGFPGKTTSPHNAALEVWVNHGVVGAILVALGLLVMGWRFSALQIWPRISAVAMVSAIFTISMTGSSFYQGWWIATIATGFVIWGSAARSVE